MTASTYLIFIPILLMAAIVVGLFFVIKYFIRYNARLHKNKQQDELDRMKIDDL